jgi:3-deoxy-D-manno-octulosonate 8-phosphate phosphatase (KDO 8-P phosphatase)
VTQLDSSRWARIRLFAMDVDGVLTDGTVFIASDGSEAKQFSIIDGYGLARLRQAGVSLAWISGRASEATSARARELKIPHLIQGRLDKAEALRSLLADLNVAPEEACYMGDDEIDAAAIRLAGIGVAPPEAMPLALAAADYVTKKPAGRGAVREVCDLIYHARGSSASGDRQ